MNNQNFSNLVARNEVFREFRLILYNGSPLSDSSALPSAVEGGKRNRIVVLEQPTISVSTTGCYTPFRVPWHCDSNGHSCT